MHTDAPIVKRAFRTDVLSQYLHITVEKRHDILVLGDARILRVNYGKKCLPVTLSTLRFLKLVLTV